MNHIFSERFKSARNMSGLSLQGLADKLNNKISRQALHKYEKGDVIPDSEMLGYLSDALSVRPDYFFREIDVELGEIEFRKAEKMSSKQKTIVVEKTREEVARYLELEEIIGIEHVFDNPLKNIVINSTSDVEGAAITIRDVWKLGTDPLYNIVELLEDHHIKVIELDEAEGFEGLQAWIKSKSIPVIVLNSGETIQDDRKRFTALHELAHLLLNMSHLDEKKKEEFCNYFAGAMLFPNDIAKIELGPKRSKLFINELGVIKQQYGISIQALLYRLKDLKIISVSYFNQLMAHMKQMGWKLVEPSEYQYRGMEKSNRFKQLLYRALAEDLISMSKAAELSNMKLAEFRSKSLIM